MQQNTMSLVRVHVATVDIDVQVPGDSGEEAITIAVNTVRKANLRLRSRHGSTIYTSQKNVDFKAHVVATRAPKIGDTFVVPSTRIVKIHN